MKRAQIVFVLLLMVASASKISGQVYYYGPGAAGRKYSKIEQFYTPVEKGVPIPAKRKPYSESQFDSNGNLLKYTFIPYDSVYKPSINTYRYENNKGVEQMIDGRRSFCTYNSSGDTLEVKEYGYAAYGKENTLVKRLVYTYGSNGRKSVVTAYAGLTDTAIDKSTFIYDDRNLLVRQQYISLLPVERVEATVINTYNSSGNVIKSDLDAPPMNFKVQTHYTYNEKGWLTECTSTFNVNTDSASSTKHIYSYNAEGLVIRDHYVWPEMDGLIDYMYTAR